MKKISAILITHNEEEKIERALRSLHSVSDEIIVVDSYSTDTTTEICRRYTDRVIERSWDGYRAQKLPRSRLRAFVRACSTSPHPGPPVGQESRPL